jgi:hypothetical protein
MRDMGGLIIRNSSSRYMACSAGVWSDWGVVCPDLVHSASAAHLQMQGSRNVAISS